jgi:hypothetical protein
MAVRKKTTKSPRHQGKKTCFHHTDTSVEGLCLRPEDTTPDKFRAPTLSAHSFLIVVSVMSWWFSTFFSWCLGDLVVFFGRR